MNIDLRNKRAVVSGSTAGIGLAIARGLAEAGAHVVINGRTEARVQAAIADIRATTADATCRASQPIWARRRERLHS